MTTEPPEPVRAAPDESALEPVELIRRSGAVLRIGRLALSAGTGSYRVKSHMWRVGRALGLDRVAAHVTLTEITATSHRGPIFRTELTEVRAVGINADRLNELERFAASLPTSARLDDVEAGLERIASRPPLYGPVLNALWAGLACAAFAFLNNGGWVECGAVLVAAALGQGVRRAMLHRGINQFGVTMLAAAVASLTYLGLVVALSSLAGVDGSHEAGYVSAVLFLVPGFALVTGALDLAKLDFSAGVARLTYALMVLASAALAVWGVSAVAGLAPDPVPPPVIAEPALVLLRALASFLGVLGFALMFNSPWTMALGAAGIGTVANVGRLALVDGGAVPQAAAAAAALLVGLLAAVVAPALRVPRITVSVPAVVIMVPGVTAYRAVYEFNTGATTQALAYAVETGLVVVALAIGLAVARMLTDPRWTFER
ncbi:threonine/serine ThrE exporter family protein [Cellulosimicrobium marinum]|uniref:threonine/serine ThrE exporter family protein n=1 Tax=Cellulosimicrobium marinum TaxID=1638992 RepID=UPI001E43C1F9|nr:threonine/serine exporter family protein [Cellulosimicrobium marinum]MCB7135065.1 threonine/serine exporter family protein [Cellulosimicrobium marinum]